MKRYSNPYIGDYPEYFKSSHGEFYLVSDVEAELKRRDDALAIAVEALDLLMEHDGLPDTGYLIINEALSTIKGSSHD